MEIGAFSRALRGEAEAWESLVEEHKQPVFRLAYLLLGDASEAEDVTQETFLRAYQRLNRFDPQRSLRPWLLGISRNLARNRSRSLGRYWGAIERYARTYLDGSKATPEDRTQSQAEADSLWKALRMLNQNDQEVIYLRYYLDLSTEETGESLGIPTGTVKSRLNRALARLGGIIAREFPELAEGWAE